MGTSAPVVAHRVGKYTYSYQLAGTNTQYSYYAQGRLRDGDGAVISGSTATSTTYLNNPCY